MHLFSTYAGKGSSRQDLIAHESIFFSKHEEIGSTWQDLGGKSEVIILTSLTVISVKSNGTSDNSQKGPFLRNMPRSMKKDGMTYFSIGGKSWPGGVQ